MRTAVVISTLLIFCLSAYGRECICLKHMAMSLFSAAYSAQSSVTLDWCYACVYKQLGGEEREGDCQQVVAFRACTLRRDGVGKG